MKIITDTTIIQKHVYMDPPAEQIFESRESLIKGVQGHARSRGYAVAIKKSSKDKNVYLKCDRGGIYIDRVQTEEGQLRRDTATRRINCPFQLYGRVIASGGWKLSVQNPEHNHDPDYDNKISHPTARRFDQEQLSMVFHLSDKGLKPREIVDAFRIRYPNSVIKPRDVYNARDLWRKKRAAAEHTAIIEEPDLTPLSHTLTALVSSQHIPQHSITRPDSPPLESTTKRKAPPKCSTCGTIGHNRKFHKKPRELVR